MTVFDDVPDGYWAKDRIDWAVGRRFMSGVKEHLFMPEGRVPRADYLLWVSRFVRRAGRKTLPAAPDAAQGFVTREESAAVLSRAAGVLGIVTTMQYVDLGGLYADYEDVDPAYAGAFQTAYKLGLIPEQAAPGRLDPKGFVTRAQTAALFHRLYHILAGMAG